MFELKEQHLTWTLTRIAESLNEEGFKTQQGSMFTKVQVKRILDKRDFYSGTYRYGDIEAIGLHEAIL
ncbi:Recombinase [compost metagenome]